MVLSSHLACVEDMPASLEEGLPPVLHHPPQVPPLLPGQEAQGHGCLLFLQDVMVSHVHPEPLHTAVIHSDFYVTQATC